jgi:sRNA-binding carbon storage regulator CsrA
VRLGFEAPIDVGLYREEILEAIERERENREHERRNRR